MIAITFYLHDIIYYPYSRQNSSKNKKIFKRVCKIFAYIKKRNVIARFSTLQSHFNINQANFGRLLRDNYSPKSNLSKTTCACCIDCAVYAHNFTSTV